MDTAEKFAKIIFITHAHYDHFDPKSIEKISNKNTIIVSIASVVFKLRELGYSKDKLIIVKPNQEGEIEGIKYETFVSYNIDKQFHPLEDGNVGYHLYIDGIKYTIVGDSDATKELEKIKTNVLFLPIGGTYTMTALEAAKLANIIKPNLVIPEHYGAIVGNKEDSKIFVESLDKDLDYQILI